MREIPSRGRYFPITASSFASATRGWSLRGNMPRVLRNPEGAFAKARAIAKLRPGRDVVLFSLSDEIDQGFGSRAASTAIEALSRWKNEQDASVEGRSRSIAVFLDLPAALRVVETPLKYNRRKFDA